MPALTGAAWGEDPRALSSAAWVDARCRAALSRLIEELWASLHAFSPRLLFLGGSAALGEAIGWEAEQLVLSDLDLGVVTDLWVPPSSQSSVRANASTQSVSGGPEITVGFYQTSALDRQAPTLGWVDLAAAAIPLKGESELRSRMKAPAVSALPRYEAFRLAGNRALELWNAAAELSREPSVPEVRARWAHATAKAATGLWTSWLVLRGEYRIGLEARLALLEEADTVRTSSARPPDVTSGTPAEIRGAAGAFREYFRRPSASAVPPEGLDLYRLALPLLLAEAHESPLERVLLREPLSLRDQFRRWRHAKRSAPIAPLPALWQSISRGDPLGTWENRLLALALRYWIEPGPTPAWSEACTRWIGRELPHEPASIFALRSMGWR